MWYEADYVKGRYLTSNEMLNIVWPECVLRRDPFTLSNYDKLNYIVCDNTRNIYYIDLNDCKHMSMKERIESWNKEREIHKKVGY